MAPPLLTLRDCAITFGGKPLFEHVDLSLAARSRACLVGRNGSGKSTLLKILAGTIEPDTGERFVQPGTKIAYLPQAPNFTGFATIHAFVAAGSPGAARPDRHEVDEMLDRLGLDGDRAPGSLSGGETRRAAIAAALIGAPDILLLDEPTNHLDLDTILWLEEELAASSAAILTISHDRAFLTRLTQNSLWLRHNRLVVAPVGYGKFDAWAQALARDQARAHERLTQKLKAEEHWRVHGVTARRKRNQGRLRKLEELRTARREFLHDPKKAKLSADAGQLSGRLVIEALELAKSYRDTRVLRDFSTRIMRGDRVGIIGANGSGKTTLLNLLLGRLAPDSGTVRHGTKLDIAVADQMRDALDPEETLWRTLIPGGGDMLIVGGKQRHIVAYLRDFLFDEKQARSPIKTLSGGEQNRLALAAILARPANLLVLDEPTNDLDMETLDVLEEMLDEYEGTLLLVSHDRDFLDRVVTSTIALEGDGKAIEYAGGYSDAMAARARQKEQNRAALKKSRSAKNGPPKSRTTGPAKKLSYGEQRELDSLPQRIERLAQAADQLETALNDPDLYRKNPDAHAATAEKLIEVRTALEQAETSWLQLEERREHLAAGDA